MEGLRFGKIIGNNAGMKLLIIDDHALLREGLVALLQQFEQGVDVLQASEAEEGLRLAEAHPDLDAVFLDLNMPDQGGMEVIPVFAKRRPQLPVIVLSSSEDPNDVSLALKSGAFGYLPKSASPRNVLSALRLVLAGEIYVPPLLLNYTATLAVEAGRPAVWVVLSIAIAAAAALCRGALRRGRDSHYSAAGAGSIVTLVLLAFTDLGALQTETSIVASAVLGLAFGQRLTRTIK